jgi:hypothetical protein
MDTSNKSGQSVPVLNFAVMDALAIACKKEFDVDKTDRRAKEDQWLKNRRQVRGVYDPEIEKVIPADRSKAYPRYTRVKCVGTVARLMELMFPKSEDNFLVAPSPVAQISAADVQVILDQLMTETGMADPMNPPAKSVVQAKVQKIAADKAIKMHQTVKDQLAEIVYVDLAKRVVKSGVEYGIGLVQGPFIREVNETTWVYDAAMRKYIAKTVDRLAPDYSFCPVWEYYPQMSAQSVPNMMREHRRHVMSRAQVRALAERPDFYGQRIEQYLLDHQDGDYKEEHWEISLRAAPSDKQNTNVGNGKNLYVVLERWGFVSGKHLRAAGAEVAESDLDTEYQASFWYVGNTAIKLVISPFGERTRMFHSFVFDEDEISLLGSGLPEILRDTQMGLCEATRMVFDNGSSVCLPSYEVNYGLLDRQSDGQPGPGTVHERDDDSQTAQIPAVRQLQGNAFINELMAIIDLCMRNGDQEASLPPPGVGDVSQGGSEAMRTQGNLSMILSAGALPIRDVVRNFDRFTKSIVESCVEWNRKYNPDQEIQGDFDVQARGSTSLVAKEVRSTQLDQFAVTLSEEERAELNTRKLLEERMKAKDLPLDLLIEEEESKANAAARAQQQQEMSEQQKTLIEAQVRDLVAGAIAKLAKAKKDGVAASTDLYSSIMEIISHGDNTEAKAGNNGTAGATI